MPNPALPPPHHHQAALGNPEHTAGEPGLSSFAVLATGQPDTACDCCLAGPGRLEWAAGRFTSKLSPPLSPSRRRGHLCWSRLSWADWLSSSTSPAIALPGLPTPESSMWNQPAGGRRAQPSASLCRQVSDIAPTWRLEGSTWNLARRGDRREARGS